MPLLDQLKQFSEPGNPQGVCLINSAITAHVLMNGPDVLNDKSTLKLPLSSGEEEFELAKIKTGESDPASGLDVTQLSDGAKKVWRAKTEDSAKENGEGMINWLSSSDARPGVYVASVGDEDDDHFFNIVKTDEGALYLLDSSQHNFIALKDQTDVGMTVNDGVEKVPFVEMYCDDEMRLDYCGGLHPECKEALKAEVKRSVAQELGAKKTSVSPPEERKTAIKV
jgi:hypothetical protein